MSRSPRCYLIHFLVETKLIVGIDGIYNFGQEFALIFHYSILGAKKMRGIRAPRPEGATKFVSSQ